MNMQKVSSNWLFFLASYRGYNLLLSNMIEIGKAWSLACLVPATLELYNLGISIQYDASFVINDCIYCLLDPAT